MTRARILMAALLVTAACKLPPIHWPPSPAPSASPSPSPAPVPSATPTPEPSDAPPSTLPAPPSPEPSPSPSAPVPQPTPATCPPLVRWGTSLGVLTPHGYYLDSTPRFGSGRGQPCNAEHRAVCSVDPGDPNSPWRHCEDPRGGQWEVRGGARLVDVCNPGSLYGFCAHVRGPGQIQVCPLNDVQDEDRQPVRVVGDGCSGWVDVP